MLRFPKGFVVSPTQSGRNQANPIFTHNHKFCWLKIVLKNTLHTIYPYFYIEQKHVQ